MSLNTSWIIVTNKESIFIRNQTSWNAVICPFILGPFIRHPLCEQIYECKKNNENVIKDSRDATQGYLFTGLEYFTEEYNLTLTLDTK